MTSHLRVLLVEDNAGDADLVQEYLSQASQAVFEVECVPRLTQAISLSGTRSDRRHPLRPWVARQLGS